MRKIFWVLLALSFITFACDETTMKAPAFYSHTADLNRLATENKGDCNKFGTSLNSYLDTNKDALEAATREGMDSAFYKNPMNIAYSLLMAANLYGFTKQIDECKGAGSAEFNKAMEKYQSIEGMNEAVLAGSQYQQELDKKEEGEGN